MEVWICKNIRKLVWFDRVIGGNVAARDFWVYFIIILGNKGSIPVGIDLAGHIKIIELTSSYGILALDAFFSLPFVFIERAKAG